MKRNAMAVAFALAGLLVAGCGGGGGGNGEPAPQDGAAGGGAAETITVEMSEFAFKPADLTAKAGQEVTIELKNVGGVTHNLHIPDLGVESPQVAGGATETFSFTPDKTGTFKIVCTEPGHEQAGMVGNLTVQ